MASLRSRVRVRVSKNRKKSWGKHCDITDVDNYLEKKRFEERIGGSVYEKPIEDLYSLNTDIVLAKPKSSKNRSKILDLKCYRSLTAYSKVPVPVNPEKGGLRKKKDEIPEKKLRKLMSLPQTTKKKSSSSALALRDLWADDDKKVDPELQELVNYQDEITKTRPVKVPSFRYQKPSLLPSVEVPHPGSSYNPSYQDHQDLLKQAVVVEEKKLKEELHLKRVLLDMFPTKDEAPTEATVIAEMSQGLFDEDAGSENENNSTVLSVNPPVTTEGRKSKSQKRKRKELKKQERLRLLEKKKKKEMNQVFRLKSISSEIKKAEKLSEERQKMREQRELEKMYKPRVLSQYKYEPNDLEVNLTEELPGSMRALKVEGNVLEDRYKSFQKRNIIETRIKQKHKRKYKLKVQVKRSHRNFK